jgi:rare lipoprotein A (peptidoglycan hydrolase)
VVILVTLMMVSGLGVALAQTEEGIAHHYSDKFEGKKTASGETYDRAGSPPRTRSSRSAPRSR